MYSTEVRPELGVTKAELVDMSAKVIIDFAKITVRLFNHFQILRLSPQLSNTHVHWV